VSPYMSVGRCIYCRSTKPPLTAEHIIPRGMGGTDQLLTATCEDCRLLTHAFETDMQRNALWPIRRLHGVSSKGPQSELIPARRTDNEGNSYTELRRPEDISLKGFFPVFAEPPGILIKRPATANPPISGAYIVHDARLAFKPESVGSSAIIPMSSFAKMLAKIAHAQAVKTFKLDGFIPFLPPVIRGLDENWGKFIGRPSLRQSFRFRPPPHWDTWVHLFRHDQTGDVLAHIRLLGKSGTPIYEILIGQYWGVPLPRHTPEAMV